jgi:glyoxylase-like metal-dependent hydrolase (beta-lactamase superfamily II)
MNRLAEDVFHLPLMPRNAMNAYVLGDVLVDAGVALSGKKIVKAVAGHTIGVHVLTHAHGDHAGGSKHVCDALGVPLWVGSADAPAVRTGKPVHGAGVTGTIMSKVATFAPVTVTEELHEGEKVGPGFTVLEVPGHSAGHIALWRERDRTLVCGDVFFNMNIVTTAYGLHEPPAGLTPDPPRNRESARRLAELEPELVLFGHGPPLRDTAKLRAFAGSLN